MGELPEELLMEILSKLPVEPLVRFKCVCKSWYAMLESPKFVSKHMAKQSKDHVIILTHNAKGNFLSFIPSIGNDGDDVPCIATLDLDLKYPTYEDRIRHLSMHGYCDGVVLLSDYDEVTILCNPAIRDVRILPKCTSFLHHATGENTHHAIITAVGFGYDSKSKDYKVVRVLAFPTEEDSDYSRVLPNKAEVFSLRTDSTWREVKGAIGATLYESDVFEQHFNGVHYWCAGDEDTKKRVVVSFDMATEVFKKAPIPDVCDNTQIERAMGVYKNEFIAMFVWPDFGDEKCIDVWVMKEFGIKESWTKQLTIGPLIELGRPLVFWKNDKELLLEDWSNRQLVSYDLDTLESKILPIDLKNCGYVIWRTYSYKKTLVSVNKKEDITV